MALATDSINELAPTSVRAEKIERPLEKVAHLEGIHVLLIEDDRGALEAMAKLLRA